MGLPGGKNERAIQALKILRAGSILSKPDSSKLGDSKLDQVAGAFHPQGPELVRSIIAEVAAERYDEAKALMSQLVTGSMATPSGGNGEGQPGEGEGEGEGQPGDGDGEGNGEANGNPSDGKPSDGKPSDGKPTGGKPSDGKPMGGNPSGGVMPKSAFKAPAKPEQIPDSMKSGNLGDYVPKPIIKKEKLAELEESRRDDEDGTVQVITGEPHPGATLEADMPYPKMYVHTLSPNVTRRVRGKGRSEWKSATQGLKIRVNRLALNAANPCGGGRLFETRHLGGTVLIDGSGSMSISDKILYQIAEKFPAGKVAYYSGKIDAPIGTWEHMKGHYERAGWTQEKFEDLWSGNLVIYAQNGKIRKDHGLALPLRDSANLVDYQAILWLLKQPGPRYLMTDWGFTGTAKLYETGDRSAQRCRETKENHRLPEHE